MKEMREKVGRNNDPLLPLLLYDAVGSMTPKLAGRKRKRSRSAVSIMARSQSQGRSSSRDLRERSGVRDPIMLEVAVKKQRLSERRLGKQGKQGVWDRHVYTKKPKHLFSGKRGIGKTQRR